MDPSDIVVKKCGVRYQPPCLVIYYETRNSKQLRRRIMPLYQFDEKSDAKLAATNLKKKHYIYLSSLADDKLENLCRIIQINFKSNGDDASEERFQIKNSNQNDNDEEEENIASEKESKVLPELENPTVESSKWDSDSDEPFF